MTDKFKALLWDNDGLLVDTEQYYFQANRQILSSLGIEVTTELFVEHFLLGSAGLNYILRDQGLNEQKVEEIRTERNALYAKLIDSQEITVAGAEQALAILAPHYRMCIVTSSRPEHFAQIHRRTKILPQMEFVITSADVSRTKPDPEPYLKAVQKMGLLPNECLAIEDSERGLRAATQAGVSCWVVPTELTKGCDFSAAGKKFSSITKLARELIAR